MNKHDPISRLLIFCDRSIFILTFVIFIAGISLLLDAVFEAGTLSYIVTYVVAIPLGVYLLVALGCTYYYPVEGRLLLSMLLSEYQDAKSSLRRELLEKTSLNLQGLESHSNTDDLRGNIVEAIRLEIMNDVKVGNQLLTMWEQVKNEIDSRNLLVTKLNGMDQSLVRDNAIEFLSRQCEKDTTHGETIVTEADKMLKNILEKSKFVEVLSQM